MTDRQKLVYDLSMQCAAVVVMREPQILTSVPNAVLEAFTSSVEMYNTMLGEPLNDAFEALKNVKP